ncbi:tripartite tricarboxylate transporter substrate binding protein [Alcaligenaceae bacterium]|nr:tripartite tricarboxylate transporter substrate binding protein [Alcaligenaceae bacterium]
MLITLIRYGMRICSIRIALAMLLAQITFAAVASSAFPSGPISLVVGFTPGGSNDAIARALSPKLSEILGVPVVVENRPGAAGAIGTAYTVNAKPDGQTITLGSSSVLSIAPVAKSNIPYKPTDLQAVTTIATSTSLIAVNPSLPANSMQELIELAKQRRVSLASAGAGGISHLNIEYLATETGGDFLHVAYKGAAAGVTDVVGGQVDGIVMDYSALKGMLDQGRLKAIASSKPLDGVDTSPMVMSPWYGVMTSAKVPKSAVKTLHAAFVTALADPEVKETLAQLNVEPFVLPTPEEADAYIREDSARWEQVIKASGLTFE